MTLNFYHWYFGSFYKSGTFESSVALEYIAEDNQSKIVIVSCIPYTKKRKRPRDSFSFYKNSFTKQKRFLKSTPQSCIHISDKNNLSKFNIYKIKNQMRKSIWLPSKLIWLYYNASPPCVIRTFFHKIVAY